jgi:hypothetical protein
MADSKPRQLKGGRFVVRHLGQRQAEYIHC